MTDWGADSLEGLPQVGEVIAGKYRVERVLGVGGMGVVVEATHTRLDEKIAIKFLSGAEARDPERVTRFTREAWAAAKIKSEHVARVTDVAELDDGTAYLVMEYLEGHDLDALLQQGALPVEAAVDYVLQAAEALAEAHQLGIVHRDLKPGNLFLTHRADGSPCIKVLDFGISKFSQAGAMTQTSELMGSPLYMAPEQILSAKHVDARADVWALGVILYELIAGTPPFDGENLTLLIQQVLTGHARPLGDAAPHVPASLQAAIMRCLAVTPEDRFADLAALSAALAEHGSAGAHSSARFIHGVLVGEPSPAPAHSTTPAVVSVDRSHAAIGSDPTLVAETRPVAGKETTPPVTKPVAPARISLGWLMAVIVAAVATGGIAVAVWLGSRPDASPAVESAAADTGVDAALWPSDTASAVATDGTESASSGPSEPTAVPTEPSAETSEPPTTAPRSPPQTTNAVPTSPPAATHPAALPVRPSATPPATASKEEPWNPYLDR